MAARVTAAQKKQRRRETVDLEFLLRRTRRAIVNEAPPVVDRTPARPAVGEVKVAMSKHAMERCELMAVDPELVRVLVARPAIVYAQREGRWIAQHADEDVAAIYSETDGLRTVVTVLFRTPFSRTPPAA